MIGSQVSKAQCEKILDYIHIGKEEGAVVLDVGEANKQDGALSGEHYVQPTVLKGTNDMRVFQEEIFGPVIALTPFSAMEEAIVIANDTPYGLGAGVWSGAVKESRFGRENHKMALDHYCVVKNRFTSYDKKPLGFF